MTDTDWITLCPPDEITDSREFTLSGQSVFVVRQGDVLTAYYNRCPHLGVSLNFLPDRFLTLEKDFIQCSMHGALFLPDSGECVFGPCQGQQLRPLQIRIADGILQIESPRISDSATH